MRTYYVQGTVLDTREAENKRDTSSLCSHEELLTPHHNTDHTDY